MGSGIFWYLKKRREKLLARRVPPSGQTPYFRAAFDASRHLLHDGEACATFPSW